MLGKRILGLILIVLGALFALDNLHYVRLAWGSLWPLFLLLPGIAFHAAYFGSRNKSNVGFLVPGAILTTYGLLFVFLTIFGWNLLQILWPIFILGVALGLFELYVFGPREAALLIPVGILSLVGLSFLLINLLHVGGGMLIGLVLILAGAVIVLQSKGSGIKHK